MFVIEKDIPPPKRHMGRRSKKREAILETMRSMSAGDSFRVEYKLASMRNFLRICGVEGIFRAAQDTDVHVRVWRVA